MYWRKLKFYTHDAELFSFRFKNLAEDAVGGCIFQDSTAMKDVFTWDELPVPDESNRLAGAFLGVSGDALILAGARYEAAGNDLDQDRLENGNSRTRVFGGHWTVK